MRYALIVLTLAASAVQAQRTPPEGAREQAQDKARTVPGAASKGVKACHEDFERFCQGVKPGEGRLGACLKKNAKKLSKPCRRWLAHGGQGHADEAFSELDKPITTAPAKP
jgi:hypothetical protein